MHLFNLNEFGSRYGIDMTVGDFKDYVTQASLAATEGIASMLRYGDFATYVTRRDVFRVNRTMGVGAVQETPLRLSRGFIGDVSAVVVRYSGSILGMQNNDASQYTSARDVAEDGESDYTLIDAERGLVTINQIDMTDQWVWVEYAGGLASTSNEVFQNVPDWLKEAGMLQTAIHLTRNRVFQNEGDNSAEVLQKALTPIINGNWRGNPSYYTPVQSQAV